MNSLERERKTVCIVCGKETILQCSRCHSVNYCNFEHQKKHWKEHKNICQVPPHSLVFGPFSAEEEKEKTYLSEGLYRLGCKNLYLYFDAIQDYEKHLCTILEVGCGNGFVLKKLAGRYGKQHVIGIDNYACPLYKKKVFMKPCFSTVQEYLKKESKKEKTSTSPIILFLNWASPNYSEYDFESFILVRPAWCVVVLDTVGTAGSLKFLGLLHKLGLELERFQLWKSLLLPTEEEFAKCKNYRIVHTTTRYGQTSYEPLCYKIILLSRVWKEEEDAAMEKKWKLSAPKQISGEFYFDAFHGTLDLSGFNPETLKKLAAEENMDVATLLEQCKKIHQGKIINSCNTTFQ